MRREYRRLNKAGKGAYLDGLANVGYHRKYLIALFNGAIAPTKPRHQHACCRHRRPHYSESAIKVLYEKSSPFGKIHKWRNAKSAAALNM